MIQEINGRLSLEIHKNTDEFLAVVAEGIDFIKADHLRQRFPGKTDVIIKQIGSCGRREMIPARNGRECLVIVLQIREHSLNRECGDTHTAKGEWILLCIGSMTYRTDISSGPVKQRTFTIRKNTVRNLLPVIIFDPWSFTAAFRAGLIVRNEPD